MIALLRSFAVSPSGILLGQSSPIACSMPRVFAPGLDFDSRSVEPSSGAGAARPSEGHCRNRRDTQHLSFAVIFRLFARTAGKRCKLLLRQEMQIAVVLMDPVAVAVEAASHGAQKRLHFVSHAMFDQRLYRLTPSPAPRPPRPSRAKPIRPVEMKPPVAPQPCIIGRTAPQQLRDLRVEHTATAATQIGRAHV